MSGSKTFVPLTATAPSGTGPQSAASAAARSFVPFTTASSTASTTHAAPRQTAPQTAPCTGKPEVEAITKDGIVTRIRVTCGCGEVIEVDCLYPANV